MVTERDDELEALPGEVAGDSLRLAVGQLLMVIFDLTASGSPERSRAMNEAMAAEIRIRQALTRRSINGGSQ